MGWGAVILSVLLLCAFLPGSPSALVWPFEWGVILAWSVVGALTWWWYERKRTVSGKQPIAPEQQAPEQ